MKKIVVFSLFFWGSLQAQNANPFDHSAVEVGTVNAFEEDAPPENDSEIQEGGNPDGSNDPAAVSIDQYVPLSVIVTLLLVIGTVEQRKKSKSAGKF